jgi:hypothetical protein
VQFHAEVLPQNKGMLAVFNRSGFPVKQEFAEGLAHVTLSLIAPSAGLPGSEEREGEDRVL